METKIKKKPKSRRRPGGNTGKLRIGDNWNAITIIALSQNNPLKAIAEFVENSIDAKAQNITIIRGKERGELYLRVIDDGEGIPLNDEGTPDFKYVATHICDSIKRRLREKGAQGIQGEFGIGLLSFWTIGKCLILSSSGKDGSAYQMEMKKNEPGYTIIKKRTLFSSQGTELIIHPLLPGIRQLNGERIQNYLASELRDRIRKSGVKIKIKDRYSRKEFDVQPRQFTGRLLHDFNVLETEQGDIYLELYLNAYSPENTVSLFRSGTRVLPSITKLDFFNKEPWTSGYLQGMIDVSYLQLTPGTRDGVVQDGNFHIFCTSLDAVEEKLKEVVESEKKAEDEKASRNILRSVQRALKEAFLALPREEYDWFDVHPLIKETGQKRRETSLFTEGEDSLPAQKVAQNETLNISGADDTRKFFEYPGPLYKAIIFPASCIIRVRESKDFHCIPRDRNKRIIENDVDINWEIKEGDGALSNTTNEIITFTAPEEPGLTILKATVTQGEIVCTAESIITVTESLIEKQNQKSEELHKGIPGYTFLRAPGELWRSKYDEKNNLIVINNGHRDYVFVSKKRSTKLKYICRLFAKELVLINFPGFNRDEVLERMIELSLYTEEHLR